MLNINQKMNDFIQNIDWEKNPIGPIEKWPQALISSLNLISAASHPMAIYWGKDLVMFYNHAWGRLLGEKHPQAFAQPFHRTFPRIWDQFKTTFDFVLSEKGSAEMKDHRSSQNQDQGPPFNCILNPIPLDDEKIGGILSIYLGLSEQNELNKSFHQKDCVANLACSAASLGIIKWELTNDSVAWKNDEVNKILGINSKDGPLSYNIFLTEAIVPEDRSSFKNTVNEAMIPGQRFKTKCCIRRKNDGQLRLIEISGQIHFVNPSKPQSLLCVIADITEGKDNEAIKDHSAFEHITILNNLESALILTDPSGEIIYQNPAARKLIKIDIESQVDQNSVHFDDHIRLFDIEGNPLPSERWPMAKILRGENFEYEEFIIKTLHDGKIFNASCSGKLIMDELNNPRFAMLSIHDITKEKKAQTALKNERQLLQAIYDTIPVMLTIYDPNIEEVIVNKHLERVTGWTQEDTKSTNIMELAYPDPEYRREIADYMQSLESGFKDILITTKDNKKIETSWANVTIPDGRQVGIGLDISDRIRAEKALKEYSDRLQFLHKIDQAILSAHSEKEVAQAVVERIPDLLPNCVYADVTLINPSKKETNIIASSNPKGFIPEGNWPLPEGPSWETIKELLSSGKKLNNQDWDKLPVSSAFKNHLSELGVSSFVHYPIVIQKQLIGTLNLGMQDQDILNSVDKEIIQELLTPLSIGIEHERLHQQTLEKNRQFLETIINNIPIAVSLISGKDFKFIFANPTYYEISSTKNLIGKSLDQIWHDPDKDFARLCKQVLENKKPYYVEDDHFLNANSSDESNQVRYASWWLFPVEIPEEDEMGILNMAYETTERHQAEEALINAERLTIIGRMAASLAHEINNPIQSVVGCLGLAVENMSIGKDPSQFMDVAIEELVRASRIVHRLRDLGKKQEDKKELTDINKLLEKVLILTKKQAQNQDVDVHWKPNEHIPLTPLTSDRIQQVFLNLVLNAIEAMPEGGILKINTKQTKNPSGVLITFTDTGKGIPQDELDKLFEAFHSTKQLGLGLGLYVSNSIISEHGGTIDIESEVGKGSTFKVWLPLNNLTN